MPNWCENYITITGTKKQIKDIKEILEKIEDGGDTCVFKTLIGGPDKIEDDETGIKTITSQSEYWGTKWDVCVSDCSFVFEDKKIYLSPQTAWSPPIQFGIKLSEKFGVSLEMVYYEPGMNFSGKAIIKKGELIKDYQYEYLEGLYHLDDEQFWNEINSDIEFKLENGILEEEKYISEFSYLSKKDKEELSKLIKDISIRITNN